MVCASVSIFVIATCCKDFKQVEAFHRSGFLFDLLRVINFNPLDVSYLKWNAKTMACAITVEISRGGDNNPWSTIGVRRGQHLLFSASHRDVLTAFAAVFAGVETVCVFHGDALQDLKGRFFLGYKPTICTSYNVSTVQSTVFVLHHVLPRYIVRGVEGVYVFGERAHLSNRAERTHGINGAHCSDAWHMSSPMSIHQIRYGHAVGADSSAGTCSVLLNADLLHEWVSMGRRFALALTRDGLLRMAMTTVDSATLVVSWMWLDGVPAIPFTLSAEGAVSVTVAPESENQLERQVLFVFSEASQKISVLRTPSLASSEVVGSLHELCIVPSSCPALSLELYPRGFVQPLAVVRGWNIDFFCPFSISRDVRKRPLASCVASLNLAAIDLHEGILEVQSVISSTAIRVVVAPSMEIRVLDIPAVHYALQPVLQHALSTLTLIQGLPLTRVYELLRFMLAALWQSVNDSKPASFWSSWGALAEHLKYLFIRGIASPEAYSAFCSEVRSEEATRQQHTRRCSDGGDLRPTGGAGKLDPSAFASKFVDPLLISADDIDFAVGTDFQSFIWSSELEDGDDDGEASASLDSPPTRWTTKECTLLVLGLHTLFESMKIQRTLWGGLEHLGTLLADLFAILGLQQFVRYHSTLVCVAEDSTAVLRAFDGNVAIETLLTQKDIIESFGCCSERLLHGIPYDLNCILAMLVEGESRDASRWLRLPAANHHPIGVANLIFDIYFETFVQLGAVQQRQPRHAWWCSLAEALVKRGMTFDFIRNNISCGVSMLVARALHIAKASADDTWSDAMFEAIGRVDKLRPDVQAPLNSSSEVVRMAVERSVGKLYHVTLGDDDGVNMDADYSKLWADGRLDAVQATLNTATPVSLPGRGDGSDTNHVALKNLSRKLLALPLGRGMLTLSTRNFRVRDAIPVPPLNLDGRTSDGIFIANEIATASPELLLWPQFHNGCAAGLRFLPLRSSNGVPVLSRHWVVYQTRGPNHTPAKAGLLYASGLLGHLSTLQLTDIYSLLAPSSHFQGSQSPSRDPLTLSVILGLSCSFRGTHNDVVFRCLSVHLQSLTSMNADLDVSIECQTGALLSIGLLCQGTENPFLVDMMLSEMGRLPSDEHCKHRTGYTLAAGMSLGLVLLGKGRQGLEGVEDRLLAFMNGSRRDSHKARTDAVVDFEERFGKDANGLFLTRALLHQVSCPTAPPCNKIFESPFYNIAVTAPGAIVALGLMYLKTNDVLMADKLKLVDTIVGMEGVMPQHCLLRTCVSSLVMWDAMEPTRDWLYQTCVPSCLLDLAKRTRQQCELAPAQVRYLMMNMGHVLSGGVLALGLRFVGSMSVDARSTIMGELKGFINGHIGTSGIAMSSVQKTTGAFEECISSCAVALSLVMAGTGDTSCFHLLRKLLKRSTVTYGSHMAASMAIGLLFLGGGKLTLSNTSESIAALLIAFYPTWPRDAADNTVHLQILRHFYVLAVTGRLIQTIDAITSQPVSVHMRLTLSNQRYVAPVSTSESTDMSPLWSPPPKEQQQQQSITINVSTPCLLPDLSTIRSIEIRSAAHFTLSVPMQTLFGQNYRNNSDSILVKVLAKDLSPTDQAPRDSIAEMYFKDCVQLLCRKKSHLSPTEALLHIDNLKMLFRLTATLFSSHELDAASCGNAMPISGPYLLTQDCVEALRRVLEGYYGSLMRSLTSSTRKHVLHAVLVDRMSPCDVAASAASSAAQSGDVRIDPEVFCQLNESIDRKDDLIVDKTSSRSLLLLQQWLTQALHFYGLALCSNELSVSLLALFDQLQDTQSVNAQQLLLLLFTSKHPGTLSITQLRRIAGLCAVWNA